MEWDWEDDPMDAARAEWRNRQSSAHDERKTWERGYSALGFSPRPSQKVFHQSPAMFKGFSGSVGSGKSQALALEALQLAYENPGLPGVIAAPTYPMLRDVTRAAFLDLVRAADLPHTFHKSDNEVTLTDCGSIIRFRSLDNPERLVGPNLAWFGADELTYCKPDAWRRMIARVRHKGAARLCGFASWTPKGFDWVYDKFIGPDRNTNYAAVLAKPGENADGLRPGYYDDLKADYDERFYRQEVLGEYLSVFAGQVYYAFDRALNVRPLEFDPRLPLCWSLDFNVDPMASVLCQIAGDELRVLREIVLPNSNTPEVCRVFRERVDPWLRVALGERPGVVPIQVRLYGDPAGNARSRSGPDRSDWKIIRDFLAGESASLPSVSMVGSSAPPVKARVNAVNAMLCNASGVRRMILDPSCKETLADLEQVKWKVDAHGNSIGDLDKTDSKRTHATDALGYLVEKEFGLRLHGGPVGKMIG